jgi:hypothetical protein
LGLAATLPLSNIPCDQKISIRVETEINILPLSENLFSFLQTSAYEIDEHFCESQKFKTDYFHGVGILADYDAALPHSSRPYVISQPDNDI